MIEFKKEVVAQFVDEAPLQLKQLLSDVEHYKKTIPDALKEVLLLPIELEWKLLFAVMIGVFYDTKHTPSPERGYD